MRLHNRIYLFILFSIGSIYISCNNSQPKVTNTGTSGEVSIAIDESFKKLFTYQVSTFEAIYPNAKIKASYLPESDLFSRLLNDSSKVIIMGRDLTVAEKKVLKSNNLFPVTTKIAEDAIAVIVNLKSEINNLSVNEVKQMVLGKYKEKMQVVFDTKGSENAGYIKDSLLHGENFSDNVFALNSTNQVIDYVSKNKSTLGFIGYNQISNSNDPLTDSILKKIKVVAISKDSLSTPFKPYQAYIKTKEYPFCRNIFMINRQTDGGLGTGFVIFVAGEKGQLMILKSGLVPAFPPQRIIHINTN
jgi:phosphate transport system substrate-binding protein